MVDSKNINKTLLKTIFEELNKQKGIEVNSNSLQSAMIKNEDSNISSVALSFSGGNGLAFRYNRNNKRIGGVVNCNLHSLNIDDLENSKASFLIL